MKSQLFNSRSHRFIQVKKEEKFASFFFLLLSFILLPSIIIEQDIATCFASCKEQRPSLSSFHKLWSDILTQIKTMVISFVEKGKTLSYYRFDALNELSLPLLPPFFLKSHGIEQESHPTAPLHSTAACCHRIEARRRHLHLGTGWCDDKSLLLLPIDQLLPPRVLKPLQEQVRRRRLALLRILASLEGEQRAAGREADVHHLG